jgi:hypothetical protein
MPDGGPGTNVEERLARGDVGVNKLDECCKAHDIAYSKAEDHKDVRKADDVLIGCSGNLGDDSSPEWSRKVVQTLIGAKKIGEDLGVVDKMMFTGGGYTKPSDPARTLRRRMRRKSNRLYKAHGNNI